MKLNLKKTGLILAASSAFLVANAMADSHGGTKFYGKIGLEAAQRTTKANKDADSHGGLALREGGNRVGFTGTKEVDGGVSVTGNLEFQVKTINTTGLTPRHANVMVKMANGGTLGLGQQNNLRISSGWNSNAWNYQSSELSRAVNGPRYTGISYVHPFGMGSFGLMVGMDDADNGDKKTAATTDDVAQNALDKTTLRLVLNPSDALKVEVGYDAAEGDKKTDPATKKDTALAVSFNQGQIGVHLGYAMLTQENQSLDLDGDKTDVVYKNADVNSMSLNAKFDAGSVTPFIGMKTRTYTYKTATADAKKEGTVAIDKAETNMSLGVNFSLWGGSAYAAYDSTANASGVEGNDTTDISAGLFYSF